MTVLVPIPGGEDLVLDHLVLDVNGTLSDRGEPIVAALRALDLLSRELELHVLSADTFGTAAALAVDVHATFRQIRDGQDKCDYVQALGADRCVAIGNGRNDATMLEAAALGIAVIGPEGTHRSALYCADVVALSIDEALGLLVEPRTLTATLRP
jgi:soluble P-type ATPase